MADFIYSCIEVFGHAARAEDGVADLTDVRSRAAHIEPMPAVGLPDILRDLCSPANRAYENLSDPMLAQWRAHHLAAFDQA